jgi:uncharacterized protein YeaO (DUF488 family)
VAARIKKEDVRVERWMRELDPNDELRSGVMEGIS